jgi:hypothetical protein
MLSSGVLTTAQAARTGPAVRGRLLVTRRDPATRQYRALGFLDQLSDGGYEFAYLADAISGPDFVPLVGFSDLRRRYRRPHLFPLFSERVISAKRPDRPEYLASLRLDADADAWEILSASGGHREGDSIELISLPTFDKVTGRSTARFLAHAVSYLEPLDSEHLSRLTSGQRLELRPEPTNPVNPEAIEIVDGLYSLGYVPDPLLDYASTVLAGGDGELTVVKANPADAHPHLRLLLQLDGTIDGPFPFDTARWRTTS